MGYKNSIMSLKGNKTLTLRRLPYLHELFVASLHFDIHSIFKARRDAIKQN